MMEQTPTVRLESNPYQSDAIFGPLWQNFDAIPGLEWQSYGNHEKNHKVFVTFRGQTKAVGFAHELVVLSKEKLKALVEIYFGDVEGDGV